MSEIAFIDVKPRRVDTGAEVTVRLAGGGTDTPYRRGGENYRAGVVAMPRFRAGFGFDDNGWTGGTVPTNGELGFMPGDSALVTALLAYYWRDAAITIDAGDERAALTRRLTGTVADLVANDGQMILTITDPGKSLDKPLLGSGFTGAGGIEGPSEATGRAKRRSWGRVYNVEGELLDKVNNIYEFGDPSKPIGSFDFVRDKGREGAIVALAWQGSIAATFAALQASAPPQGGCVAAPSIACVKWWTVPAGPLTADIRGENTGGYVETPVAIVAKMLAAVGGPAIANQAAAEALRTAPCGVHIASGADTIAQAIDRLLLGVSLYWVLQPDATIRIGEWAWGAPAASFQAIFIARERQLPPVKSRKVGYRRNHRVHSDSEISAAVILSDDITYLDGTPLEDLKPAEGGAQSNRPPTDKSPAPPVELPHGTMWFDAGGHPYRFGSRPWIGGDGSPWIGGDGTPWLGGGYEDVQDQIGPEASRAALLAQNAADDARGEADLANIRLGEIASDNILTPGEKPGLILDVTTINNESGGISAQAAAFGITTEKAGYEAALSALNGYLATLTAPTAWNALGGNTAIDGVTFRAAFNALYSARQTLLNKVAEVAKSRGDLGVTLANAAGEAVIVAQADATAALNKVAAIVADGVLDKSEKPDVVLRYNSALSEQPGIQNNAVYYAITTEKTAYDAAVAALTAYLTGLAPAYNDYTADTAIDRVAFNSAFKTFYDARQALLDRIAVEAGRSTATMTLAPAQTILCDYLFAPKTGQLPRTLVNIRQRGNARVDAVSTWTATFPGTVTGTIDTTSGDNNRGNITITAMTGEGEIIVTSSNDGITLSGKVKITPIPDAPPPPPPPSGTGATSAQSFEDQTNSTASYLSTGVVIGPVRAPSSGSIKLEAVLNFSRSSAGTNNAFGKWGYSTSSTGFTDVAGGEGASSSDADVYLGNPFEPIGDDSYNTPGSLTVVRTASALTPGTDYWFEFRPRKGTTYSGDTGDTNTFYGLKKATQI